MAALFDTHIPADGLLRETKMAVCVEVRTGVTNFGGSREVWIPKSQIKWEAPGRCYAPTLHIPVWLALKHRLAA